MLDCMNFPVELINFEILDSYAGVPINRYQGGPNNQVDTLFKFFKKKICYSKRKIYKRPNTLYFFFFIVNYPLRYNKLK